MFSASHWRQAVCPRIYSGWPRWRRNAFSGNGVERRSRLAPAPFLNNLRRRRMSVLTRPVIHAVGLSIALASAAAAQAKSCDVNESRPTQIGRATLAVQIASSQTNAQAAQKQLQSAVKLLTDNGERMENQVGRNLVLGKALVLWTTQPDMPLVTKRGP